MIMKTVSRQYPISSGEQNHPQGKTTVLEYLGENSFLVFFKQKFVDNIGNGVFSPHPFKPKLPSQFIH
jgi:hypothetical protein